MRMFISIKKISEKNGIHYYAVFKEKTENINYYIGLDSHDKKIFFYQNSSFQDVFGVYSLNNDKFEKIDEHLLGDVNGRVIMKGLKALSENNFPETISWAG